MNLAITELWQDYFGLKSKKQKELTEFLSQNILFCTLTPFELKTLCSNVYERVYQTGECIFEKGDRGIGMYLIKLGSVNILGHPMDPVKPIATIGQGSFFGEIALIEPDNLRSAHAVALERTELIGFFKPDLNDILQRRPLMGIKILKQLNLVLAHRLVMTTEKLTHWTPPRNWSNATKLQNDSDNIENAAKLIPLKESNKKNQDTKLIHLKKKKSLLKNKKTFLSKKNGSKTIHESEPSMAPILQLIESQEIQKKLNPQKKNLDQGENHKETPQANSKNHKSHLKAS